MNRLITFYYRPFLALVVLAMAFPAFGQIPDADPYKVYDAILKMFAKDRAPDELGNPGLKLFVIRKDLNTDYANDPSRRNWGYVKTQLTGLSDVTLRDYENKSKTGGFLKPNFEIRVPYKLLSKPDIDGIFHSRRDHQKMEESWALFFKNYPNSYGYISFSDVGFNKERDQAFVYFVHICQGLCGSGHYILLNSPNGIWEVKSKLMVWTS